MQISPLTLPAGPSSLRPQFGFTLVELLIASVVLAVGLLALTSAGAAIVKLERRGQQLSRMAAAGETRLELLRALGCSAAPGIGDASGQLEERWSVTQTMPRVRALVDSVVSNGESGGTTSSSVYVFRSAVRC